MKLSILTLAVASLGLTAAVASAAPVGVDGVIGADWAGITPTHIGYSAGAATGNFGSPSNVSDTSAYNIYLRAQGAYIYAAVATDAANSPPSALPASQLYANLYFGAGTGASTSSIGFEVTNGRAFKPGAPTYYPVVSSDYSWVTNAATGVVEASFPKSAFMTTELGVTGFVPGNDYVVLGLSQSLGLSVVGGSTLFGPTQLGGVLLPEPTTLAALAGTGILGLRRRRA